MTGLLSNLKLRQKLLVALAPLVLMAILAVLYASYESAQIDAWYPQLIHKEDKAVGSIDMALVLKRR